MKIVIAPDTYKGSLAAVDAAAAIAEGILSVCANVQVDVCPMADGGEGTVAAMVAATGGRLLRADVFGPLGAPLRAHYALLGQRTEAALPGLLGLAAAEVSAEGEGTPADGPGGTTAVIEMAAASGLGLVAYEHRDPRRTTTYGTGQLIMAAIDAGARRVILGIGGSATVDGGAGALQAMGVRFYDRDGEPVVCGLAGGGLKDIARIDATGLDRHITPGTIRVAADVTNPLLGPNGAASVYGPQKGATEEVVAELERALAHFARLIADVTGIDVTGLCGGGAAGGLGAGLVALAGATIEPGVDVVADAVGLARRLAGAALCITGEGCLDSQTAYGKVAAGVAKYAKAAGVPVVCLPGQIGEDAPLDLFDRVLPLAQRPSEVNEARWNAAALLKARAGKIIKEFLAS